MRSLRVRLPLLAAGILAVSLGLATFLAYQLVVVVGERDVDQALQRELRRFQLAVTESSRTHAQPPGGTGEVTAADVQAAVEDYFRLNPGGNTTVTVARIGGATRISAEPPDALEELAAAKAIPAPVRSTGPETLDTPAGEVRSLSAPVRAGDTQVGTVQVVTPLTPVSAETRRSLLRMGLVAALSLLAGGALIAIVLYRALAPLVELAHAARRTANFDDLRVRVREPGEHDEVGVLAREFNQMLDRLEHAARDQTEFLAAASHELRTPVTIARGHIETLERAAATAEPDRVAATAGLVREELEHIARLVEDLMALSRAKLDDFVVPRPLDLDAFFRDLELRLDAIGHDHVEVLPPPATSACGDEHRLGQALLNLILNAVLHTPPGTRIRAWAHQVPDGVAFTVQDNGPGIDPAIRDRARQPFIKSVPPGGHDSSGLGLAVVAAIAEAHHGSLTIDTGEGGTTVTLLIPHTAGPEAQPRHDA